MLFIQLHYTLRQSHSKNLPTTSCHYKQLRTLANPRCDSVQAHTVSVFHHHCPLKPPKDQFNQQIFHRGQSRRAGRLWQLYIFFLNGPLAPELPPSRPLADGANEPLFAVLLNSVTLELKCCSLYCHNPNTSANASEVNKACSTARD